MSTSLQIEPIVLLRFFSGKNTSSKYTSKITIDNTQNTNINNNPLTNTVNVIKILNLPTVVNPEINYFLLQINISLYPLKSTTTTSSTLYTTCLTNNTYINSKNTLQSENISSSKKNLNNIANTQILLTPINLHLPITTIVS